MWLGTLEATTIHANVIPDLRLPGWTEYQDALELAVSAAVSGEKEIQAALDECAETWNRVTERVGGREKQMQYYEDIAASV
jgi:hypothetical protein